MEPQIKIFSKEEETAEQLAANLYTKLKNYNDSQKKFNIALSGGNTPKILFRILAENYSHKINWKKINLFWGDERCVPPDDPESNYGMTKHTLLDFIIIPQKNIFRIKGEINPFVESKNYSKTIENNIPSVNKFPSFDMILLGLGKDGHTASIFPNQMSLINKSNKICETSIHPDSMQKRITLTGKVINNSKWVVFLVTGEKKSLIISKILKKQKEAKDFPAYYINPTSGILEWYLDKSSAKYL